MRVARNGERRVENEIRMKMYKETQPFYIYPESFLILLVSPDHRMVGKG